MLCLFISWSLDRVDLSQLKSTEVNLTGCGYVGKGWSLPRVETQNFEVEVW